jgi:hypothetical protein
VIVAACLALVAVVALLAAVVVVVIGALNQRDHVGGTVIDALLAEMHRDRAAFLTLVGQVNTIIEDDRAERRRLLHAVMARTPGEYVSIERAAPADTDPRRPWTPDSYNTALEQLLAAHDDGSAIRPAPADLLPVDLQG